MGTSTTSPIIRSHRTFNLREAADFLKMHWQTLRRKAKAGIIPGAKVAKEWVFVEDDLVNYVRSLYPQPRQVPQCATLEKPKCHSTNAATSGGSASRTPTARKYEELLGLRTNGKRRNTTTNSRRASGEKPAMGTTEA